MTVSDAELRTMIRASIARHLEGDATSGERLVVASIADHPSHLRLPVAQGGDETGMCIIEPSVRCTHCGFCQSYGH